MILRSYAMPVILGFIIRVKYFATQSTFIPCTDQQPANKQQPTTNIYLILILVLSYTYILDKHNLCRLAISNNGQQSLFTVLCLLITILS